VNDWKQEEDQDAVGSQGLQGEPLFMCIGRLTQLKSLVLTVNAIDETGMPATQTPFSAATMSISPPKTTLTLRCIPHNAYLHSI